MTKSAEFRFFEVCQTPAPAPMFDNLLHLYCITMTSVVENIQLTGWFRLCNVSIFYLQLYKQDESMQDLNTGKR